VSTIEFTQIQATVMHGLSVGNEVLKQLHQEMSLEKVERLMDQTREGVEYQRVRRFSFPQNRLLIIAGDRRNFTIKDESRRGGGSPSRARGITAGSNGSC
jgi:hypothetical protein